jgi:predicted RNA binding protein YcfA (HicA-like mRNA interferase family)
VKLRKLKKTSGKDCLKILCNKFGFKAVRRRGSHVVLRKETESAAVGTSVPLHKELKLGTIKNILKLAKVSEEEFAEYQ